MERTWSTDSVASIPEKSLPDPSRLRKAPRRLSNQASIQGAREWRKSRPHQSNGNAGANANANLNVSTDGVSTNHFPYLANNGIAGPSTRRLSHSTPATSTAHPSQAGAIRRRNILDSAAAAPDHKSKRHSHHPSSSASSPRPPSSSGSGFSLWPTTSDDFSGSSTDRPTRRRRSATVESREAYSADPSADGAGGYASSSDQHSSSSEYEPFDWDVGRKRKSSDRPRSIPSENFLLKALGGSGPAASNAHLAAMRPSASASPPPHGVSGSGSDRRSSSRSTKFTIGKNRSPKKQSQHLPSDSSTNTHAASRSAPRSNRESILTRAIGAAGSLTPSTKAAATAASYGSGQTSATLHQGRRGSQDRAAVGAATGSLTATRSATGAESCNKAGLEATRSSSASNAAAPAGSNGANLAASSGPSCKGLTSNWRRLRVNPSLEALLMSLASCIAYYGLKTHEKRETQSHASEVGFVTIISTLYFFLRDPDEQAAIWATDHRNYRTCPEDGALNALLLPPLLACATLFSAIQDQAAGRSSARASGEALPNPPWLVEGPPVILSHDRKLAGGMTTLVVSRYSLVSTMCMTSTVLLCHLLATKWIRRPYEFPKSNWTKLRSFTAFSTVIAIALELVKDAAAYYGFPLWSNLARWEVITASLFFQANLYTISRLARKSFTLGELGIVAAVGVTLAMETLHLFVAKLLPVTTPYVKAFRRPTPLLIFQLALIVGTFMVGFLLSPLLYLSRNLAQKPTHRLRWPDKRDLHRRLLAGFFYLFATIYVVGVLGMWVRWLLVRRDPWLWTLSFMLKGARPWSRPVLVTYWVLLISISISCWQAVVSNAKRFRSLTNSYHRPMLSSKAPVGTAAANNSSAQLKLQQQQQQQINQASPPNVVLSVSPSSHAPGGVEVTTEGVIPPAGGDQNAAAPNGTAVNGSNGGAGDNASNAKRGVGVNLKLSTLSGSASLLAKEHNTAAIKKASHLSLNARRKFFHALAVLLFLPGIALDPAFTHLGFSLAFSIFIFAEYVRYYALYPFGAALHVFMSEFLDHKDSGPVILSHFYLLTGCAGPLWLEGHSRILQQTGVLVLGVGDALASVIGRRYGRIYWPGGSSKTVEGTVAFITSIMASAWLLRLVGWCERFDSLKYGAVITSLGLLEGVSDQHDNLVLPIFGYIVASLVGL